VEVENIVAATGTPVKPELNFDGLWLGADSISEEINALLKPDPSLCDVPVVNVFLPGQ